MNKDPQEVAAEIKQKSVIDMALTFTAMIRLFEKGSKPKITQKLYSHFQGLVRIKTLADFDEFHETFCEWFINNIRVAQKERNGRIVKQTGFCLYGQAAKLIDVALKVYVYYSGLPDKKTSDALVPLLNTAIDNPILRHIRETFPHESILSRTVEQIDKGTYKRLQELIKHDIKARFENGVVPTQYDDIMWYRLNRED
jgi:hypothetical protein